MHQTPLIASATLGNVRQCGAEVGVIELVRQDVVLLQNRNRQRLLNALMSFEKLARLPTRFLTGYFTAVLALKSSS